MGPLVTREHRDRVASYVENAPGEGATVLVDGREDAPVVVRGLAHLGLLRRQHVLIGAAIDVLAHQLLWSGVSDGSDGHVRRGETADVVDVAGYPEVGQ